MRNVRKWLYIQTLNLIAHIAPSDVRAIHQEVFSRGMKAYDESRTMPVLTEDDRTLKELKAWREHLNEMRAP